MERFFGTWQGRLPREIEAAGIKTLEAANKYIRMKFLPWPNRTLSVKPKEEESAFVPAGGADLEGILCVQGDRIVGNDNTVHWGRKKLQILPQSWRSGLAKCRVRVCEHLDGNLSVRYGHRIVDWYDSEGKLLELYKTKAA